MTLQRGLDARRADFTAKAPPEQVAAYQRGVDELAARGFADRAVKTGETAPDFTLPDARGDSVTLSALLRDGPMVLTSYRGGWCRYCNLQLRDYQHVLPGIEALGARRVAVSPEAPDETLSTAQKNELAFPVLSDVDGAVGRAWRLTFELSDELRGLYAANSMDLARINAAGHRELPPPATCAIARAGVIALAFVDVEHRRRLEPAHGLDVLRTLRGRCAR